MKERGASAGVRSADEAKKVLARSVVTGFAKYAPTALLGPVEAALLQLKDDTLAAMGARLASPGAKPKFESGVMRIAVRAHEDQYILTCLASLDFFTALNEAQPWSTYADDERIWDPSQAVSSLRAAYVRLFRPGDYGRFSLTPERIAPLLCAERLLEMLGGERRTAFLPDYYRRLEAIASRIASVQQCLGAVFALNDLAESAVPGTRLSLGLDADDVLLLADMGSDARQRVLDLATERGHYTRELAGVAVENASCPLLQGAL